MPISQSVNELKHLIEKYNEAIFELRHKAEKRAAHEKNDERIHQLIHELRAELMHLDEIHHHANQSIFEKQSHFFKHHTEALAHANVHWFHARRHLELLFELELAEDAELEEEEEELLALQHRMKHLAEEIEREQYELNEALNYSPMQPHPHPEPPHPNEEDKDKDA